MRKLLLVLLVPVAGYLGLRWYMHHEVRVAVDQAISAASQVAVISYKGTIADFDGTVGVEGLRYEPLVGAGAFTADSLVVRFGSLSAARNAGSMFTPDGPLPEALGFSAHGLRATVDMATLQQQVAANGGLSTNLNGLDVAACGELVDGTQALKALGVAEIVTDLDFDYRLDASQRAILLEARATGRELVAVTLSLTMVADGPFANALELAQRKLVAKRGAFSLEDRGYYAKLAALCAGKAKLAPPAWLAAHVAAVVDRLAAAGITPSADLIAGYRRFRGAPGKFELSFANTELYTLERLKLWSPADLPRVLGLRVAFNGQEVNDYGIAFAPVAAAVTAEQPAPAGAAPTPLAATSAPGAAPSAAPTSASATGSVPWSKLDANLGSWITVEMQDGRERIGILRQVDPYHLVVEVHLGGGSVTMPLERDRIASVRLGR